MGLLQNNLKLRMVAYLLLLSILIVTALAAIAYFRSTDTLREAAFKQLRVIADDRENKINQFVEDQQTNIVRIARTPAIRDTTDQLLSREPGAPEYGTSYDTLDRMLRSSTASSPGLDTIFFMTDTGEIAFSTDKSIEGQSRSASKFFTQGWNGPIVQNVYPSPVTSKPTITVAAPLFGVFGSEGKRLGVAAAHVRFSKLDDIVDSRTGLGETGEAYLINPSNLFISTDGFGTPEFPGGVHSAGIDAAVKKKKGLGIYSNYTNTTVVGIYRWMPKLELALLVEMHIGEALAPARQLGLTIIGVGLAAVLLLVIGVYFITSQVLKPVLAMTDATVKIADGDLTQTLPVITRDEMGVLAGNFNHMTDRLRTTLEDLEAEQEKSDRLLLNVLPQSIAERLKQGEEHIADSHPEVSVLFADVVGFTSLSTKVTPLELLELLNHLFSAFDQLSEKYNLEKIKTIGDAYMVVGGLPTPQSDHAEAIAEIALDMQEYVERFNEETNRGLTIRIGISSGPVVAGVVGTKKFLYDIWGDTVNTAARMESQGIEGCIQVTEETYRLLHRKYHLEGRGVVDIKGKGEMYVYILKGRKAAASVHQETEAGF